MTTDTYPDGIEAALTRGFAMPFPPERRASIDHRVTAAMTAEAARRESRRGRRYRRPVMLGVALLVVSGIVSGVGAVGQIVRPEWGSFPSQQRTPAEINAEIAAAMKTTPVPPGYVFPDLSVPDDGSVWGSYGGQSMVEFSAMCGWYRDWTVALAGSDRSRMNRDRAMMDKFFNWKTIADPNLADESVRDGLRRLNAAADAGDPAPINEFLAGNCSR